MNQKSEPLPQPAEDESMSRPPGHLHDFALEMRWEITRRHPIYLVFWKDAWLYCQNQPGETPKQQLGRYVAMLMLASIGVGGEPIDPDTPFAKLIDDRTDPRFLTGSVQPVSLRHVLTMLLGALPPTERMLVGALFSKSVDNNPALKGDDNGGFTNAKKAALGELIRVPSAVLDSSPVAPLFYMHLEASQRSIARDIEDQVRRWKKLRGITERRIHLDKLPTNLKVWDMREGWSRNGYQRSKEQTFIDVARKLRKSVSSVVKQYMSAFNMITGKKFTPARWQKLFGPVKISALFGDPAEVLSAKTRHHLSARTRRPIPDSVVSPINEASQSIGVVEANTAISSNEELDDMQIDICDLIARGFSDEEIARKLELGDAGVVAYFRGRTEEFSHVW